ncbi:unnamed protein product [Bursaphelenchus okinawaensis]|uniref:Uncharacterized protein n=1 Tax=Bursaphelenchus okinawaensis TaxID=465554 RepID=A0A811JPT5_9BILA|nr:unnamed protein product [Bursaphelenchus okinawaensis]CAG9077040.1 unnamed protein product [Bursaphelenchus okinawaensis]
MDNPLTYNVPPKPKKDKVITDLPPDFWFCLCKTHVHKGSFIVGLVGAIITLLYFVYICFDTDSWEMMALSAPSVVSYLLLMLGQKKEKVGLYWPHLIINSLYLLGYLTFIVLLSLQMKEAYDTVFPPDMPPEQVAYYKHIGRIFYIRHSLAIAVTTILMIITCYLLKVAYRGFRYVSEVINPSKELSPELRAQVRDFVRRQEEAYNAPTPSNQSLSISTRDSVGVPNSTSTPIASPQSRQNSHSSPAVYKI